MPFDERIYREVGRVALAWSELERRTFSMLRVLADEGAFISRQATQVLVAGMALPAQWDSIEQLLQKMPAADPNSLDWFKQWRQTAEQLRTRRNDVVHSSWLIDGNDPRPSAMAIDTGSRKARPGLRWDLVPGGVAEVADTADKIEQHHVALARQIGLEFRRLNPDASRAPLGDHPIVSTGTRLDPSPEA